MKLATNFSFSLAKARENEKFLGSFHKSNIKWELIRDPLLMVNIEILGID